MCFQLKMVKAGTEHRYCVWHGRRTLTSMVTFMQESLWEPQNLRCTERLLFLVKTEKRNEGCSQEEQECVYSPSTLNSGFLCLFKYLLPETAPILSPWSKNVPLVSGTLVTGGPSGMGQAW